MPTQPNPFSTRFVQPGAIPYLFEAGSLGEVIDSFERHGRWGQIVGPHGSGKTTLLKAMGHELDSAEYHIAWHELHDGERRLPAAPADIRSWTDRTIVIVDGYEQLSWWSRRRLQRACRRRSAGLLITAHAPQRGLPVLLETRPSLDLAQQIVEKGVGCFFREQTETIGETSTAAKKAPDPFSVITPDDVARQYEAAGGDIREMLFRLYDLYEERV